MFKNRSIQLKIMKPDKDDSHEDYFTPTNVEKCIDSVVVAVGRLGWGLAGLIIACKVYDTANSIVQHVVRTKIK